MGQSDVPTNECTINSAICRLHDHWLLLIFIAVIFTLLIVAAVVFVILRAKYRKKKLRDRRRSSQTLPFYLGLGQDGGQGRADASADVQLRRLSTRFPSVAERRQSRITSLGTRSTSGTGPHAATQIVDAETTVAQQSFPQTAVRSESVDTLPRYDEVVRREDQEAWAKAQLHGGVGVAI